MLAFFEQIIKSSNIQYELEEYIRAHNPTSCADVERLIKQYSYGTLRIWL
jgi:hypothetical protein